MIKSQYAGGILLQPVQKLVATLIFALACKGKNATESIPVYQKFQIPKWVSGIFYMPRDSNDQIAICRGHIAATSSKTGGYLNFYPCIQGQKCNRVPSGVPKNNGKRTASNKDIGSLVSLAWGLLSFTLPEYAQL